MSKFFISTAIDYVNGHPHIGHALEKIQADVLARYHRLLGDDVFFLSGTDENSLKSVGMAEKEGMEVKDLVDRNSGKFRELKTVLNLSLDDFIRTTEERHIKGAQKLWLACEKDIYKKKYKGLYCVGCEEFYKEEELEDGLCPEHKKKPELIEEENYFFKLSNYQDKLKELIENDEIKLIPQTKKNEILSFINQKLDDICISRSTERARGWGIPVPGDLSQVIWVWFDALSNYINALGYGENEERFQEWWEKNENTIHVIGKGISRFHAVYWPGILLSAGLSLPKKILIHGYITSDGQKMSKSLGNVVGPAEMVEKYGIDPVRYFLLREIPPAKDGDFSIKKFEERYDADLAKGIGNLVSRVLSMAEKSELSSEALNLEEVQKTEFQTKTDKARQKNKKSLEEFKFNEALISIWELIGFCDQYIEKERIWEKSENKKDILYLLYAIENIGEMLSVFLPETSEKILSQINAEKNDKEWILNIKKGEPLFPRLE